MNKCAVIVDNRPSAKLDKIIEQHMAFLPGWDLNHVSHIPISNGHDYNRILTDPNFWLKLDNYQKVLIFQHDSMIIKPIPDYMLDYDFVGAPWKADAPWNTPDRRGGNGGRRKAPPTAVGKSTCKTNVSNAHTHCGERASD